MLARCKSQLRAFVPEVYVKVFSVFGLGVFFAATMFLSCANADSYPIRCEQKLFSTVVGFSKYVTFSMQPPSQTDAARISAGITLNATIENGYRPCSQNSRSCQGSAKQTRFDLHRDFDSVGRLLSLKTRARTTIIKFETQSGVDAEIYESYDCSSAPGISVLCTRECSIVTDASWGT